MKGNGKTICLMVEEGRIYLGNLSLKSNGIKEFKRRICNNGQNL